ncbi:adenylyltransferase/cytidyltransferase family protein [bacterium]|nr:adenylyltransferase/cytidyltransferase family protein [bacterium]
MSDNIVVFTGGFDPIHSGHIDLINEAAKIGRVVVGLNSDEWLSRKKGQAFLPFIEREKIIKQFKNVMQVISFDDTDGTAIDAIRKVKSNFGSAHSIIFVNGGDRTSTNIPEIEEFKDDPKVEFMFSVGGDDKKNSSSWILEKWKYQKTYRDWGYWRVLDDKGNIKTKELVIEVGESLSDQRHFHRSEHWYVLSGRLEIDTETNDPITKKTLLLTPHSTTIINAMTWHKARNIGDQPVHVVEIQYGDKCVEDDIERRD